MVATGTAETPAIDRSACPSRGGHGTRHHRHANGCTCPDGLRDQRRHNKLWRGGRPSSSLVDATGSRRRLQALAVLGYGVRVVADQLGITSPCLQRIRNGCYRQVSMTTARRVARVYRELSATAPAADTPGRQSGVARARAYAAAQGWAGPGDWVDIDDPHDLPDSAYARPADAAVNTTSLHVLRELRDDLHLGPATIARLTDLDADAVAERLDDSDRLAERRGTPAVRRRLSADDVYALRREYLATRHSTWTARRAAAKYGTSATTVTHLLQGAIRPELGLTDLTTVAGSAAALTHEAAPRPADDDPRKESAA